MTLTGVSRSDFNRKWAPRATQKGLVFSKMDDREAGV